MLAVFALREITVEHRQWLAVGVTQPADDHAALGVLAVGGKTVLHLLQRFPGQQRHPVMAFLAVIIGVIAQVADRLFRKLAVLNLGFLQAHQGGFVFAQQLFQLMQACANTIDIERDQRHDTSCLPRIVQSPTRTVRALADFAMGLPPGAVIMDLLHYRFFEESAG